MRHIVVVPYYFPPFPGSGNRWPAMRRYLRRAGHRVTIIATEPDTNVTVMTTHPIAAAGGDTGAAVAQTPAGGTVSLHLGLYDVANLESYQPTNASFNVMIACAFCCFAIWTILP